MSDLALPSSDPVAETEAEAAAVEAPVAGPSTLADELREAPERFHPDMAAHILATAPENMFEPVVSNPTNLLRPTPLTRDDTRAGRGRIAANYLGLVGPVPSLPESYTHAAIGERKRRSPALFEFLELFANRLRALHVAAHRKYRLASLLQSHRSGTSNSIARMVFAFMGFSGAKEREATPLDSDVPLFYAGYFTDQRRTAISLERMLADFLGLPVAVEQFRPRRLAIAPDEQTRMGLGHDANAALGVSALAGATAVDRRGAIRVRIGPVGYREYLALMPDGPLTVQLAELVRLYAGPSVAFDVQIVLQRKDVPQLRLEQRSPVGRLGWDTWALSGAATTDSEETIFEPTVSR